MNKFNRLDMDWSAFDWKVVANDGREWIFPNQEKAYDFTQALFNGDEELFYWRMVRKDV